MDKHKLKGLLNELKTEGLAESQQKKRGESRRWFIRNLVASTGILAFATTKEEAQAQVGCTPNNTTGQCSGMSNSCQVNSCNATNDTCTSNDTPNCQTNTCTTNACAVSNVCSAQNNCQINTCVADNNCAGTNQCTYNTCDTDDCFAQNKCTTDDTCTTDDQCTAFNTCVATDTDCGYFDV